MKETYDIIIEKLEKDKLRFSKDINMYIDEVENSVYAKVAYYTAHAKKQYCMELLDMFKEVRKNL